MADFENSSAKPPGLESTARLLNKVRDGDGEARERLVERYLPGLTRWAHGRLPSTARSLVDTDDIVQVALLRALDKVGTFESRHEGAFLAYIRRIVLNSVRDELRRASRQPTRVDLDEKLPHDQPSAVERAIGREVLEAYEKALATLTEGQQEAVIMRVEFNYSFPKMAEALGKPSADAARMVVARALVRLAEAMNEP